MPQDSNPPSTTASNDLNALIAQLRVDVTADFAAMTEKAGEKMLGRVTTLLQTNLAGIDARFATQDTRLDEFAARVEAMERMMATMKETREADHKNIDGIREELAMSEQGRPVPQATGFDRKIDPTIITLRTTIEVSADQAFASVQEWLVGMNIDRNQLQFSAARGAALSSRWTIRLTGPARSAAHRVQNLLQHLRRDDGSWESFQATDSGGTVAPVFISGDKSAKMVRTEVLTKHLAATCRELAPTRPWRALREAGEVLAGPHRYARVLVMDGSTKLEFNDRVTDMFEGLQRETVTANWEMRAGIAASAASWS